MFEAVELETKAVEISFGVLQDVFTSSTLRSWRRAGLLTNALLTATGDPDHAPACNTNPNTEPPRKAYLPARVGDLATSLAD